MVVVVVSVGMILLLLPPPPLLVRDRRFLKFERFFLVLLLSLPKLDVLRPISTIGEGGAYADSGSLSKRLLLLSGIRSIDRSIRGAKIIT